MNKLLSVLVASIFAASTSLSFAATNPTEADAKTEKIKATEMKKNATAESKETKQTAAATASKTDAAADYKHAVKNADADYKAASADCKTKPSAQQKVCLTDAKTARVKTIADAKADMVKAVAQAKAAKTAAAVEAKANKAKAGAEAKSAQTAAAVEVKANQAKPATEAKGVKEKTAEAVPVGAVAASVAVDEAAAQALAKRSNCLKCHSVDKDKKGPSFKKTAAALKGKPDAQSTVTTQITSGPKLKDGSDDHAIVDTKDAGQIKNLVNWILSR
jgi:cytochrome c